MIRATPFIAVALLAGAAPAFAQTQAPPSVEQVQQALDAVLAEPHDRITVTHARDDSKKTSLLVREIATSRTPHRCETEFATPKEVLRANTGSARSWRIAWGSLGEIRRDGAFKLELVPKTPDSTRTILEFPDDEFAADFAEAMEFLRKNCPS